MEELKTETLLPSPSTDVKSLAQFNSIMKVDMDEIMKLVIEEEIDLIDNDKDFEILS